MSQSNTDKHTPDPLDIELTRAMANNLLAIARIIGPRTRFGPMLSEYGAAETWRRLRQGETSGFTALWRAGRLDLTIEALVVDNPRFHTLFTADELDEMRADLREHGYEPKP